LAYHKDDHVSRNSFYGASASGKNFNNMTELIKVDKYVEPDCTVSVSEDYDNFDYIKDY